MDSSEAGLDRVEAQTPTEDQRKRRYSPINYLINHRILTILRGPPPIQSEPEFLVNLRWSDLYDLPGEYVAMNAEIFSALSYWDKEWMKELISQGTPVACLKSDRGDSILHLVASWGHLEGVKTIVSNYPCLLLEPNWKDQLPLHVAARAGHSAVVEALTATVTFFSARWPEEKRESVNDLYVLKDINGDTALNLALKGRYMKTASYLVSANRQASFLANKDNIYPLYLAVEAGDLSLVRAMLGKNGSTERSLNLESHELEGRKCLAHAALKSLRTDVLDVILDEYPSLVDELDEQGRTCLSFGASIGYHKGVCKLLDRSTKGVFVCDSDGSYPIHVAAEKGHFNVVKVMKQRCPYSAHLLNKKEQNIFHIAANCGKFKILSEWPKGEHLANEQDVDGNTPLHLATIKWRPRAVRRLAGPKNLLIQNNSGLTALDIAESNLHSNYIFRERLTLVALVDAHIKSDPKCRRTMRITRPTKPLVDGNKDFFNALLVVAALIATVTFAACITLPGGSKSSTPNLGMANLVTNPLFVIFMICDMVALVSSITAITSLIWAQVGDPALYQSSVRQASGSLYIALFCMGLAFLYSMNIAAGNAKWLTVCIDILTIPFIYVMLTMLLPHFPLHNPGFHARFRYLLTYHVARFNDDED